MHSPIRSHQSMGRRASIVDKFWFRILAPNHLIAGQYGRRRFQGNTVTRYGTTTGEETEKVPIKACPAKQRLVYVPLMTLTKQLMLPD